MDLTTLLFSFSGRINRGKFWLANLIYILVSTVFVIACIGWLGGVNPDNLFSLAGGALGIWAAALILFAAGTWSGLATGIKRLHDRGKSGWWILLFWLGPSVLGSANSTMPDTTGAMILPFAGTIVGIWGLIELGFLRGTRGPNIYGPDPLEIPAPVTKP
jgi:uncharacterized membrane protein YhaH (DUF805 family)